MQPSVDELKVWLRAYKASPFVDLEDWMINAMNKTAMTEGHLYGIETENVVAFPEVTLHHAAAGTPIDADVDSFTPTRDLGPGRFAVQLHGDSMAPTYPDGSILIMRGRDSLNRPFLKKGEIYLFLVGGVKTVKIYDARKATQDEIDDGIAYVSSSGGWKTRILRSINRDFPGIVIKEEADWIGWLDKNDNKEAP